MYISLGCEFSEFGNFGCHVKSDSGKQAHRLWHGAQDNYPGACLLTMLKKMIFNQF